jgi:18S rRNA (guanine1575-N7)-methyltransferase
MNDDYNFYVEKERPEEKFEKVSDYFKGERLVDYATSKSMMRIQEKITLRALEILDLQKKDALILDAGCGAGFTTIILNELGYRAVGLDLVAEFLYFYNMENLNLINSDMCYPPFQPQSFDAIISISALQWVYRSIKNPKMEHRLRNLAKSFYQILKPKSKSVIQFYPKSYKLMQKVGEIFASEGNFEGEFIIDNPDNPKKRKIYLFFEKE